MKIIKQFIENNTLVSLYDTAALVCERLRDETFPNKETAELASLYYDEIKYCFTRIESLNREITELIDLPEQKTNVLNLAALAGILKDAPPTASVDRGKPPEKFMAEVFFTNSYYGEDAGESKYVLEEHSKDDLKESVRKLVGEMCNSYAVDYGLPIKSRTLYKVEYSWGETTYSV